MNTKLLLTLLFMSITFSIFSQGDEEKKKREFEPNKNLQYAVTAQEMANYGYANKAPLSLLSVAELLIEHPIIDLVPEKKEKGSKKVEEEKSNNVEIVLEPKRILNDIREMANGDVHILALADSVEAKIPETTKDAVGGPKYTSDRVNSNDYNVYWVRFYGGELAEIALSGDGDTDLDIYVYDENGNLMDSDTDYSDDCYVSWYPKWTGDFRIKIKNRGNLYNNFVLITN